MPGDPSRGAKARRYQFIRLLFVFIALVETIALLIAAQRSGFSDRLAALAYDASRGGEWAAILIYATLFHALLFLIFLPQRFYLGFLLERSYGLSGESPGRWIGDQAKSAALAWILMAVSVEAFYPLVRVFPDAWWWMTGLLWSGAAVFFAQIMPAWIVPMFYPMKPLEPGPLRERIARAAARIGVPIRDIYLIALSRKTRKANAAVLGIGPAKRIVLGDTLIDRFTHDEIEFVLAHELGHQKMNHVWMGLAFNFATMMSGFWLLWAIWPGLSSAFAGGLGVGDLAAYPGLLMFAALFYFALTPVQNAFSRALERAADAFGLRFTRERAPFVSSMEKLAELNLADPHPNPAVEFFFYSHPSIGRRIRYAQEAPIP